MLDSLFNKKEKAKEAALTGTQLIKQGKFQEALQHLHKAVSLDKSNSTYFNNLAFCYGEIGDSEQACRSFETAIELDTSNKSVIFNASLLYARLEKWDKALIHARKVYEFEKDNASYKRNYAQCLAGSGNNTESLKIYDEMIQVWEMYLTEKNKTDYGQYYSDIYFEAASIYNLIGNKSKAKEYANKSLELNKNNQLTQALLVLL